ncbi:uncharacterized protein LOC127093193 isoform X2 [Lathyrus oleraceus]|uniref:uncharacterized protein LOC127093193 isoform X2 n=1 Tax=Pisum sativum TaxID=3888 RepID=UPI0021CF6B46|nr:uncharacterized protein LOC127093193 isoform X2 [Pisum sativum]
MERKNHRENERVMMNRGDDPPMIGNDWNLYRVVIAIELGSSGSSVRPVHNVNSSKGCGCRILHIVGHDFVCYGWFADVNDDCCQFWTLCYVSSDLLQDYGQGIGGSVAYMFCRLMSLFGLLQGLKL